MKEYKTQMEAARKGILTEELKTVAEKERMTPEELGSRWSLREESQSAPTKTHNVSIRRAWAQCSELKSM